MSDYRSNTFSPGFVKHNLQNSISKEDIRLNEVVPPAILDANPNLNKLLSAYYDFMNLNGGFTYATAREGIVAVLDQSASTITATLTDPNEYFIWNKGVSSGRRIFEADSFDRVMAFTAFGADSTTSLTTTTSNYNWVYTGDVDPNDPNDIAATLQPGEVASKSIIVYNTFFNSGVVTNPSLNFPVYTYVNYTGPSRVLNSIEESMDLDLASDEYITLMQKELAPIIPNNPSRSMRDVLKRIIEFYQIRGTEDSIKTFFRIFFEEEIQVEYPWDSTFILSESNWNTTTNTYNSYQSQLSDLSKLHDSDKYQKYSYIIKSGLNTSAWEDAFVRLSHPAGTRYFGEIVITTRGVAEPGTSDLIPAVDPEWTYRGGLSHSSLGSKMPGIPRGYQPGNIILMIEGEALNDMELSTGIVVTATSATGNVITVADTTTLYVGMPVYFDAAVGGLDRYDGPSDVYYVESIPSATTFTVSETGGGVAVTLTNTTSQSVTMYSAGSIAEVATSSPISNNALLVDPGVELVDPLILENGDILTLE